ncbi:15100_t:CDS:2 [Funneliformis caledonium]|uniref:15100_t:CDS:1 n=1 Tax=Funneliformis caledonium TaxID=1117310 RepID=A0A9N9DJB1_9GLOM|nr:15100_t:CDS:2 [Funneliformis caledonium]
MAIKITSNRIEITLTRMKIDALLTNEKNTWPKIISINLQ